MMARKVHWLVRWMVIGIAAASVPAGARVSDGGDTAKTTEACTLQCGSGSGVGCPENEHKAWESSSDRDAGPPAPHSECIIRTCSEQHPCESEGAPAAIAESVGAAILSNESSALLQLAERHQSVVLHRDRKAFLVLNCSGDVFALLPAPAALVESVYGSLSSE